jgi:hypothetical protein
MTGKPGISRSREARSLTGARRVVCTRAHERVQLEKVRQLIRAHQPGEDFVFPPMVPDSPKIHQLTAERKVVAIHTTEGRARFGAVADNLERRVRQ